jgi:DNA damage-binding protein 1
VSNPNNDTLPIPSGIQTIAPAALGAPRAESPDDNYDMRDAFDNREGKGGKIVKCKGNFIEVLTRYRNIAPIADAVLADPDESGQVRSMAYYVVIECLLMHVSIKPQIVTCSGGSNSGSLNVVRTGADFQELAVLQEIPDVTNIWPIRVRYEEA